MAYTRSSPTNELPGPATDRRKQISKFFQIPVKPAAGQRPPMFSNTMGSLKLPPPIQRGGPQDPFGPNQPIGNFARRLGPATQVAGGNIGKNFVSDISNTSNALGGFAGAMKRGNQNAIAGFVNPLAGTTLGGGHAPKAQLGVNKPEPNALLDYPLKATGRLFDVGVAGAQAIGQRAKEELLGLGGRPKAALGTLPGEQRLNSIFGVPFHAGQNQLPQAGSKFDEMSARFSPSTPSAEELAKQFPQPSTTVPKGGVPSAAKPAAGVGTSAGTSGTVSTIPGTQQGPSAATAQLNQEAANMQKYGDARGANPNGPPWYGTERGTRDSTPTIDRPAPNPQFNTLTGQDLTSQIRASRETAGYTPQDIAFQEGERRKEMQDVINRSYNTQIANQNAINEQAKNYQMALGTNLSGGAGNITSTQADAVIAQMNQNRDLISELEQKRQDAINTNQIDVSKRIQDRIDNLNTENRALTDQQGAQFKQASDVTEQNRQYAKDVASLGQTQQQIDTQRQEALANIKNLSTDNAQAAVNELLTNFGSAALKDITPDEIAALEYQAGMPIGSLQRQLTTLDQQSKEATAKAKDYQYIAGTKYQNAGFFDKSTGTFTSLAQAGKAAAAAGAASGLSGGQQDDLKAGYLAAPDKKLFMSNLPAKYANVILADKNLTQYLEAPALDEKDSRGIAKAGSYVLRDSNITAIQDGTLDRSTAEQDLASQGVDITSKPVIQVLDNAFPRKKFLGIFG